MKRGTPMKRTPFARKPLKSFNSCTEPEMRPERIKPVAVPLTRPVLYAEPANDPIVAAPKTVAHRCPALLEMARGRPCLLLLPGLCRDERETTVAVHGNLLRFGKAGARKADDFYSVWGCARCHSWLDSSYSATLEEKTSAFEAAHARQVEAWAQIAVSSTEMPRARRAAQWALDHLSSEPVTAGSR